MPQPFAAWLRAFLQTDRTYHWEQLPRRQRPLVDERQWGKAYPFTVIAGKELAIAAIRRARVESSLISVTPWLLDPEVRLMLSSAVVDYLVNTTPLMPDDLSLPVEQRAAGMVVPTQIGPLAPRVAMILLYAMTSRAAPLQSLQRPSERLLTYLITAARGRVAGAKSADLIAVHVLMRGLMRNAKQRWALEALKICLPMSPLTRLLEDSETLAAIAPYDWTGIESVLCNPGLHGLQNRCAQTLVDLLLPGWDWHTASQSTRDARFRRISELFTQLTRALDTLDGVRAMILATWIVRFYRLFGRVLELYQRVLLPPAIDPDYPTYTPPFRMLLPFLPQSQVVITENYAGMMAPLGRVITLLLEASTITGDPVYLPEGLPLPSEPSTHPESALLRAEAQILVETWKSLDTGVPQTLCNLYEYIESKRIVPVASDSESPAGGDPLDQFQFSDEIPILENSTHEGDSL